MGRREGRRRWTKAWGRWERATAMCAFLSHLPRCAPGFLGEMCQFPDPCQEAQLCQNGGSCQALLPTPLSSPSAPSPPAPSFFCTCPSGFTGKQCEAQLEDPCPPFFCSKKGRCHLQGPGRPRCSCLPGWTGEGLGQQGGCGRSRGQAGGEEDGAGSQEAWTLRPDLGSPPPRSRLTVTSTPY